MTNREQDQDRRSFASRTPVNDNPDKVVYRRGFVTRHQVTGARGRAANNETPGREPAGASHRGQS